jgi:N6-adenosine-specific RNA methylase IME4
MKVHAMAGSELSLLPDDRKGPDVRESAAAPFAGLPRGHFAAIVADPPWRFENYSEKGEAKNPNQHYACLDAAAIKSLPVAELAAKDCALFLWVTDPLLSEGLAVMEAWGFSYRTVAFTWAKTKPSGAWHFGTGYWTRANPEMCLLGARGAPQRLNRDVRQLLVANITEHSRKPTESYWRIERLVAGPYLELFSRTERPGWSCWGHEAGKFGGEAAPDCSSAPCGEERR